MKLLPKHMEGLAAVLRVKVEGIFHNITSLFITNNAGKRLFLKVLFVIALLVTAFVRTVI